MIATDISPRALDRVRVAHGAEVVDPDEIFDVQCDVLAPCALGGVLSAATIPRLRCAAIVGSANNQLATAEDAARLAARDILYAPDYVVNAGGIINIAEETAGYDWKRAAVAIDRIHDTLTAVLDTAAAEAIDPVAAAERHARRRIDAVGSLGRRPPT